MASLGSAVGYGASESYALTYSRTGLPVESGFVLDAAAMMDMRLSGLAIPPATLDAFRQGVVRLWLIPKGNEAFSLRDGYQRQDLFGQELRQVFNEHYKKIDEATCFEVWCFNHQTEDAIVK